MSIPTDVAHSSLLIWTFGWVRSKAKCYMWSGNGRLFPFSHNYYGQTLDEKWPGLSQLITLVQSDGTLLGVFLELSVLCVLRKTHPNSD